MSEKEPMDQVQQAPDAGFGSTTAGALLKTAREAQGLHIGALAVMLKVPVHKLEALEAGRHEVLSDLVFTRALAASVCRVLKIDPSPVMTALPRSDHTSVKTGQVGLNTPFKTGGSVLGHQLRNRFTKPMSLAVALLLAGILVVFLLPEGEMAEGQSIQSTEVPAAAVLPVAPAAEPAAVPASDSPAMILPAAQADVTRVQEAVGVAAAIANGAPAVLLLQSRGASWVEITDAQGLVQLRKFMEPGEEARLQGPLPLLVVLGRADVVDVHVRGERLDVNAMTKANVARFEVK
ncbi:MAG: DUF4115 domain-containing protein [Rhodoferax sp.]|nr:DUF4115 domain-containing protein [Rhodoferax sp.]